MSHSVFMPSWAALLRDQYLERSRQQPYPKRTQAYYYEIHRKPVSKSTDRQVHDVAACPFAPLQHTGTSGPPETAPMPLEPITKAIPRHLLPIYDANHPGGVVYKPVALLSDTAIGAHDHENPGFPRHPAAPKSLNPVEVSDTTIYGDQHPTEKLHHDLQPTVSEYGFFCEEHDLPIHHVCTTRYRESPPPPDHYAFAEHAPTATGILYAPRRSIATPRSPKTRPHDYPYYTRPHSAEHERAQHPHHHVSHHEGCTCDRYECRASLQKLHRPAVHTVQVPPQVPRPASMRQHETPRCHSPIRYRPHHQSKFSLRLERRPSYNRRRTPSPTRREV